MKSESVKEMKQLCVRANEQLSQQNYEGMLKAQETFAEIDALARASHRKEVRRFSKSALYNVTKAREYFEKAEFDYTHKFRVVCTWRNEREQLDTHLKGLYSDWKNLCQELEGPTIKVGEARPSSKKESLIDTMLSLRDISPQEYGGLEGSVKLMKEAKEIQEYRAGIKLTSYERNVRDKRFSLARKCAGAMVAFGTLAVGAGFGFYRGIEGMPYAGNGETIGRADIVELTAFGISAVAGYTDALLQREYPRQRLPTKLGEATLGLSLSALMGHSLGYVAGIAARKVL